MAKDFSAQPSGRRLRIPLTVYDTEKRNFKPVPDTAALVTVSGEREQRRLWKAIEKAIGDGEWRDGAGGGADRSEHVGAPV